MLRVLAAVVVSILLHELAHAFVADRCGDDTPRRFRRLTLNPLAHIHPVWSVLVPLLSFAFAGVVFGAARPMPIAYSVMTRGQQLSVASAGIIVNAVLGLGAFLVGWTILWQVNAVLVVFNLLPIPPLDGWRIWEAL